MRRVAIFGNAGGGKSTLARCLAELTHLPLYVVDMMQFRAGGVKVPQHEFLQAHVDLLRRDEWIINGFGSTALVWERCVAADTLILYRSAAAHPSPMGDKTPYQRAIRGPAGLAEQQPVWSSSIQSYRVLWPCHPHLTPKYRQLVTEAAASKRVHHLRSPAQIESFIETVKNERLKP